MKALVDAIQERYEADALLVRKAKSFYRGHDGRRERVQPCVECTVTEWTTRDTFGSDFEVVRVEFSIFTKTPRPDEADDIIENMIRVFDDCELVSDLFKIERAERLGIVGPVIIDGVYRAKMRYEFTVQRRRNNPLIRFA